MSWAGSGRAAQLLDSWIAYFHAVGGQPELAVQECAAIAAKTPNLYGNQAIWALALEKQKKYAEAISHYDRALRIESKCLEALRRRGWCHMMIYNHALALTDYNAVLAVEPDDQPTILDRAMEYHNSQKYKQAIDDCRRVIEINGKNEFAWGQLGDLQAHLKQWKEAHASASQAINLAPTFTDAYRTRAWADQEMGNSVEALADLTAAIASDPTCDAAYYSRGYLYRDQKQYDKSIADLSEAIKIDPSNPFYFCARGCAEVRNGNNRQAIADCTRSIAIAPHRTHPYLSRGEAYNNSGYYDLALLDLNHVIDHDSSNVEALTERSKVYGILEKRKLAARAMARSQPRK